MRVSSQEAGRQPGRGQRALPVWGAYSPSAVASASGLASEAASSSERGGGPHPHRTAAKDRAGDMQAAGEEGPSAPRPHPADPRPHPLLQ